MPGRGHVTETVSIRRDLLLHTLASSVAVYMVFLRNDVGYISPGQHWTYMVFALMAGGIQTVMLVGRCKVVDWWVQRAAPAQSKLRALLHRQAGLATGAVMAAVVGGVLIYDGFWMVEASHSSDPAWTVWLDLLFTGSWVIAGIAVWIYLRLFYRQIGEVYSISRRRQATALVIGLLPEIGAYGLCSALLLWLAILIGPAVA